MRIVIKLFRQALEAEAPEGRMLELLVSCHNRMSLVALSDRGYFQELDYETVAMHPTMAATRFWHIEDIAAGTIDYERSDYKTVTDQVEEASKFPELAERLREKFPEADWHGCVELTTEMQEAAVAIGRELLADGG